MHLLYYRVIGCGGICTVSEVDVALSLEQLPLGLQLLDLSGTRRDEPGLGRAGDNLDVNVILAGKEQALADWELAQTLLLFACQVEDIAQDIDGRW